MKKNICLLMVLLSFPMAVVSAGPAIHYPWIHSFERPEMPRIHCAFADGQENVIVSTGDWVDSWYDSLTGYIVYYYWSEGIFRIREGEIVQIECPANTFVLDCATDSTGITWVLFAEGRDYRTHLADAPCRLGKLESDIGFRWWKFPVGVWSRLRDYRLGYLDGLGLVEWPGVSDLIPGTPERLTSSPDGWLFLESGEWDDNVCTAGFLSWWRTDSLPYYEVMCTDDILPHATVWGYPQFGIDGLAYFLMRYFQDSLRYGVLSIDPWTGHWDIFSHVSCPYLNSETEHFYIDTLNIKWFGTEDGLVRFDGETWTRWTTENSGLPHNRVRRMLYDEIDEVYYIVTQGDQVEGSYPYAFCTLSSTGQRIGAPLELPSSEYELYHQSRVFRSAGNVFWLCPYDTGVVYSYDHERIIEWEVREWLAPDSHVSHIGSTGSGRTFCVNGYRVMIW